MKDAIILLILLSAKAAKVCSLPYQPESGGACQDPKTEYLLEDGINLCCRRCPPGQRLAQECNKSTDSVCEPCRKDQYMENWNFSPNCFSCPKCKPNKGLQYAQTCSSIVKSTCVCQPGMYCVLGFDDPYCTECRKYTTCRPGQGVSIQGTAISNVRCVPCQGGTFSDKTSYTESCQPHTDCQGRAVVRKGNATSDTVCDSAAPSSTTPPQIPINTFVNRVHTIASPTTTTTSPSLDSTLSARSSVSVAKVNHPTKATPGTDINTVAAIASVMAVILLFIIVLVLLVHCKAKQKKEAERFHPKTDANGNCEKDDKINRDDLVETQLTSFTVRSPEQQCLLETGGRYCSLSPSSNNAEIVTRMEGCSSQGCESIGAFQPATVLYNPYSTLSEPMSLLSNPESSVPPQPPSQPTSPQLISPVASNPHVKVNITFHIGNGSCGTPSVIPADSVQTDPDLPVGEEEQCLSVPQQEAGKLSLMAVQENVSYNG
ncbi:tumor necrosis factor receptor superfamily member 1B [Centroberyx affinis]|uniref:tumor necrosis factor receptor superfamily member 1B n=1 Tax=Centroberyx affinis TaxID=166261 RepID=UPI003A5BF589